MAEFLCWYRVHGTLELDAAPQLPAACIAITKSPSQRQPWSAGGVRVPRIAITLAHRNSDLVHGGRGDSMAPRNVSPSGSRSIAAPCANADTAAQAGCGRRAWKATQRWYDL